MTDSSDMSDKHSQSSDGDEHESDSDSQSSHREPIQAFVDDAAEEEFDENSSDHEDEDREDGDDGPSDSSSDGDEIIRNTNRPGRRQHSNSGDRPRGANRMFGRQSIIDDMAEEDFEQEPESESEHEDLDGLGRRRQRDNTQYSFTQFRRLPLELRERIWELFCPDLTTKARFYQFMLISSSRDYRYGPAAAPEVWEGAILSHQTEAARRVLSVHKESRKFALRSFPDELSFRGGRGIVRFQSARDVVYLEKASRFDYQNHIPMPILPRFSDKIRNLGIDPDLWSILNPGLDAYTEAFPNLQNAYFVTDYTWTKAKDMLWAAQRTHVNHYYLETFRTRLGVGEDAIYRWVWPDLATEAGKEFAREHIKPAKIGKDGHNGDYAERAWADRFEVWPLILFPMDHGEWAFQKLLDQVKKGQTDDVKWPVLEGSDDDDDSSEATDDYESSGIDDDPIEQHSAEESEDDLAVVDRSDSDRGNDDSEDDEEQDEYGNGHLPALLEDETFHGFSDPEPESGEEPPSSSATVQRESNNDSDSDRPSSPPPRTNLKRSRGRVVDSDDDEEASEGDDDEEAPRKRSRTEAMSSRRKRPSISGSEEDLDSDSDADSDVAPQSSAPRNRRRARARPRTLLVQSDDDSSEEERKMRVNAALLHPEELEDEDEESGSDNSSESSKSEDDEEEEDEEDSDDGKPSRPLTLVEKLALHREKYPDPPTDDDEEDDEDGGADGDVDAEPMGGTDYDARDYADFQDDEQGYEHLESVYHGPGEDEYDGEGKPREEYFDDGEDYGEGGEW
ncbi:hypothetical protein QBC43DRAFT_325696 [Cladorrhinum sp. PSN259]|nr:hypothetical protein QBC43DRAFT_325696 [Cladorrhinum sp. PSN259]